MRHVSVSTFNVPVHELVVSLSLSAPTWLWCESHGATCCRLSIELWPNTIEVNVTFALNTTREDVTCSSVDGHDILSSTLRAVVELGFCNLGGKTSGLLVRRLCAATVSQPDTGSRRLRAPTGDSSTFCAGTTWSLLRNLLQQL